MKTIDDIKQKLIGNLTATRSDICALRDREQALLQQLNALETITKPLEIELAEMCEQCQCEKEEKGGGGGNDANK
jgi:hypothetical protein